MVALEKICKKLYVVVTPSFTDHVKIIKVVILQIKSWKL